MEAKRTRIPAEDPEDVRNRDEAHIDKLYVGDRRIGDPPSDADALYAESGWDNAARMK